MNNVKQGLFILIKSRDRGEDRYFHIEVNNITLLSQRETEQKGGEIKQENKYWEWEERR
jgi:hypothetical protein